MSQGPQLPSSITAAHLAVLRRFPADCQPESIIPLQNAGGYSGARLWKLQSPRGSLCLRRWPKEQTSERLHFIHSVLGHVGLSPEVPIPVPILEPQGNSFVQADDHLWELTPWMPGRADYLPEKPRDKLIAACRTLAQFHIAAASHTARHLRGSSPSLLHRYEFLRHLTQGGLTELNAKLAPGIWPAMDVRARNLLEHFTLASSRVDRQLSDATIRETHLQPCIRDIWHDHVLFEGNRVTGLIDFGAMRIDCVSTDLARLLGSFAGDDRQIWTEGIRAYGDVRPLSVTESQLIDVFDASAVLLSGINWLRWIYVERRHFADAAAVLQRIDEILLRLQQLVRRT